MAVKKQKGMSGVVPVVRIPAVKQVFKKAAQQIRKSKKKAKVKKVKPVPTNMPPAGMAPPEMQDTRPVREVRITGIREAELDVPSPASSALSRDVVPITDKRLVVGAQCTFLNYMGATTMGTDGNPACPYCKGHVTEVMGDDATLEAGYRMYEDGTYPSTPGFTSRPHPGYVEFVNWMRKQTKCWPGADVAAIEYFKETGQRVDPSR